jgi:hypothetical protein
VSSPIDTNRDRLKRIYTNYRLAAMSREYYACRLSRFKQWNLGFEIVLAIGASSSAVAVWYIWKAQVGQLIWALISGLAAVLAILKPILRLPDAIERYSKLHVGYTELAYDYQMVVDEIKAHGGISHEMQEALTSAETRMKKLTMADDPKPSERLLRKCQNSVKRVVPKFPEWWALPEIKEKD